MRDTLTTVSHIAFLRRLYALSTRWPDEDFEFLLVWDSSVAREQSAVMTRSRYAKMIDKSALATDSVSELCAW